MDSFFAAQSLLSYIGKSDLR